MSPASRDSEPVQYKLQPYVTLDSFTYLQRMICASAFATLSRFRDALQDLPKLQVRSWQSQYLRIVPSLPRFSQSPVQEDQEL